MTITLTTQFGDFVTRAEIPPFDPPPEVVTWGSRTFIRNPIISKVLTYAEGLNYPILSPNVLTGPPA